MFSREVRLLDPIELFRLCADDREDSDAWSEFLRRYTAKLRYFIQGALRPSYDEATSGAIQESDLFQNAILRLVENDCAAMKRFSGKSEDDLLAYLAVICRSAVLDTLRRSNALKRRQVVPESDESVLFSATLHRFNDDLGFERDLLLEEIVSLTRNAIQGHSGDISSRDHLVFKLHFFDGLSYSQIAQCKGVNLSKAGVEKLLKRLVGRVQSLALSGRSEETVQ